MAKIIYRLFEVGDLAQIADLRWRLKTGDAPPTDPQAYDRYVADFIALHHADWRPGEVYHWVAAKAERLVAAMSVVIVRKVPGPSDLHGRWGYLTNCYTLPRVRNDGVGSGLLEAVMGWAMAERLELLVVWPSGRAYPFYERAGFSRPQDPLVLNLSA